VSKPSTDKPSDTADQTASFSQTGDPACFAPGVAASPDKQPTQAHVPIESSPDAPTEGFVEDLSGDLSAAFGDRYELEGKLGQGGFGTVFRAFDRRLNRRVAIKASRIASTDPEKLLREARSLAQLRHPGIVAVFDVAVAGTHCFVVSELLPGPSLSEWLSENTKPSFAEAVRIVAEVADALAHSHSKSIIHRDIKPSNVVFAEGQRPVLVDFGLALTDMDTSAERGIVSGTPAYMSPEQASGLAHRPDGRTDIYGLAATLYRILCGRHPFQGRSNMEVLRQVIEDEPQPPRQRSPDLPPELERVCMKGMAKLPGDRYQTASDFAEALRRSITPTAPAPATPALRVTDAPRVAAPPVIAGSSVSLRVPRIERRQVTLLQCSCDTGSVDDDPMERISAFQSVCAEVVAAHGGLLLQTSGTTFLACFGYPLAHEDSPRQAVRSALTICKRITECYVLAAVGTGPAIVTEAPNTPTVVVGEVAACTAALVAQGTHTGVVVTDATFRLVDSYFDCEAAGEVKPRGITNTVSVYRVNAERAVRNRMEAADPARLTPLIGRDREVALLRERWELAAEGVRGVILLVADPGLGKSRLVRVMRDHATRGTEAANAQDSGLYATANTRVIEWYSSPYHQASPFYPVTDYFDRTYQLSRETDATARLERLLSRLRADGVHDPEEQALFAAMLSVPGGERLPALSFSPERQKEKTQEALLNWLAGRTEHATVLFVVEDLHWIDPSTEAVLAQFVEHGGDTRVLGLFTFRPEYDPPWKGGALQTQVALNRLTKTQVAEMVRAQAGDSTIPQATIDQIAERTDGVPLFVEEFTRLVAESGSGGVSAAIPATLQDLLLARLDRMASVRDVVQLGAVIGRTFSYAVIRAACGLEESVLRAELDKLVGAGLLFPKGSHPRTTYTFKHALIQDAAYQSLVKKQRQQFHRTVATALERDFTDVPETQPELLGRHYAEAGETSRAIEYLLKAGQRARERSAYPEAVQHLKRGLELLATLPQTPERDATEFHCQLLLSACYLAYRGYAAPEVEVHVVRSRELCERLGASTALFDVMMINWALRFIRGRNREVQRLSAELVNFADTRADDGCRAEAHWASGCTLFWSGEFASSLDHLEQGERVHSESAAAEHAKFTQQNSGPLVLSYSGLSLWALGRPEQAMRKTFEAVELAKRLNHPFTQAAVIGSSGLMFVFACDAENTIRYADAALAVATEQSFAFWIALPKSMKGAAMCVMGRYAESVQLLREGLSRVEATGAEIVHQMFLGWLARALWNTGDRTGAWVTLNRAFEMTERDGERYFESELNRLKAEFLLVDDPASPQAVECLQKALTVSRHQRAKFFELRAALALGALWRTAGRLDEARALVGEVVAGFTEGFETADFARARAFLNECNQK
jgi:serine/threonine protein kinase/tetratricopeptide (TPR) repeat protein